MAALLVALGLFIYLRFESDLDSTINQSLRSRGVEIAAQLRRSEGGVRSANRILVQHEESFAQILTPAGRVYGTTSELTGQPLIDPAALRQAQSAQVLVERSNVAALDGQARLLALPAEAHGHHFVVVVGSSLEAREQSLASLRTLLVIGGPAALILASLAGYLAVGGALRPVEAMRKRAAAISAAEPDERLPVSPARDELRALAETLNEMLDRLQATLERERQFVDDASHELRTPLALHKTELEVALRYDTSRDELRHAIGSAIEEADRLAQLAEDLLVIARSDKGALELDLKTLELDRLLSDVAERFRLRAAESGRGLTVEPAEGIQVNGDRLRLEQALTNMVDNALRYGAGEVRLSAGRVNGGVEIHVADRGPGFPPGYLERAFERFTRADQARSSGGSGLGLAIVDGIASSHGGRARAANRSPGADVWIELP